jgi:hypothetical protein
MAKKEVVNGEVYEVVGDQEVSTSDFQKASHRANSDVAVRDARRKALGRTYEAEDKVSVMIAPMYAAYFGRVMHVSVNGISVSVPCDGKPYNVPETFAAVVQERLRAINDQQAKAKRFSDISRNYERAPGELALY